MGGTLRFSDDGPEFPGDFVHSLLAGDVIFLCGTGVSAPQMPDFPQLVECTYRRLAVERTDSEQFSFDQGRFEEVLGSLSRRLSDPDELTRTVSDLLAVPEVPNLDQQRTILRLSRDLDNRISVVTTNFDTLLERAETTILPGTLPRHISFAGQALPVPGSASFAGIIHIHGRLRDADLDLEKSPLVLTSPDYGDAYMRSGWAARFLFDLARCKTIALVGYSANDAPVRYFLNVLEADRARFPDLKPVYAFDAYERDPEEASRGWGTLGVTPLPYCKLNPRTGAEDHFALWRDLDALADIADHPKRSRQDRARNILERPATEADTDARRELPWLFAGNHGLWPVAIKAIVDSKWFSILEEDSLWSREEATWVLAAWISQVFEDRARLECACEWQRLLGREFTEKVEQRLMYTDGLHETWLRVWRLFCLVDPVQNSEPIYAKKRIESRLVLDSDLERAMKLIAPALTLDSFPELQNEEVSNQDPKLRDLVWARTEVPDRHGAHELIDVLCNLTDRTARILDLATGQLQSALELEANLDLIVDDYDHNDFAIPSIEPHAQNENHGGLTLLISVLVRSLPVAATADRNRARDLVKRWMSLPGRTGLRLCLHAMRSNTLFHANEAIETLLTVSDDGFWRIGREIALLMRDRAGDADATLVNTLEDRVLRSGDDYYGRYPIECGEVDWRQHARDASVWLRLNMLSDARVLSAVGTEELRAIKERREYLNRPVEDYDFFGSYVTEPRWVVGDPAPIVEAPSDDRIEVAQELIHSTEPDLRQGWTAYCRSDPQGAFDLLSKEEPKAQNGSLWSEFLVGLALGDKASVTIREDIARRVFDHLADIETESLKTISSGLAVLLMSMKHTCIAGVDRWLRRLWETAVELPQKQTETSIKKYERAIETVAGKVADALLSEIDSRRKQGVSPTTEQIQLLRRISGCDGMAGELGRAVIVRNISFVLAVDRQCVVDHLAARVNATTAEGAALRGVMLRHRPITPGVTQVLGRAVLQSAIESAASGGAAANVASNILWPALAHVRGDTAARWGITATDIATVLRETSQSIRAAALRRLVKWLGADKAGSETAWRNTFGPFFKDVWPKERAFRDVSQTHEFIALAVGAGRQFPAALEQLRPYIVPFDRGLGSLHAIGSSDMPERFPRETLSLLWLVCGPRSKGNYYEMAEIIDRLIGADPDLEVDRRLQWLKQHAERFA